MPFGRCTSMRGFPRSCVLATGLVLLLAVSVVHADERAIPLTLKVEIPPAYALGAVHGPMGLPHPDPFVLVPPMIFWTNFFRFNTLPNPGGGMRVRATEIIWHNVPLHGAEIFFRGPYACIATTVPPPGGVGLAVGFGAGGQRHIFAPSHPDITLGVVAAGYVAPAFVLGAAYASVGLHDPPPRCGGRGCVLRGQEVVPPNGSSAFGSAAVGINERDNAAAVSVTVRGITLADLTAAHIHQGGPGQNGPVIFDLGPPAMWQDLGGEGISRTIEGGFPAGVADALLAGRTYVQIHTVAFPAGEIRGQLRAAPLYSNSDDLADPYKITRTGNHCVTGGSATDLQTLLGLGTYGWGCQAASNNSVADDFMVPAGQSWLIDGIVLNLYQTGATTPTITSIDYAFLTADPLGQPPPVWTNVPVPADLTKVYKKRDIDNETAGCTRRLQRVFVPLAELYEAPAGQHWLAWRASGSGTSGPWQSPVVIQGAVKKPGANGMQSTNNGPYAMVIDGGTAQAQQDFVFELTGYVIGVPTAGACCYDNGVCLVVDIDQCGSLLGDANCDGVVDFADINAFVLALSNPDEFWATYPGCTIGNCDCNQDGVIDFNDINKFVEFISGGAPVGGTWLGPEATCADCGGCTVQCPPGARDEGEPCYTDTNGGCNSTPPVWNTIQCGDTICGTSWFDGSTRDTDWYLLNTTAPATFILTGQAEFDLQLLMVQDTGGDCVGYNYWYIWADACDTITLNSACLPPDTYYVWVGPQFTTPFGCTDGDYQYWATLQCVPCEPAPDPSPPAPGVIESGSAGIELGLLSNTVSKPE